jgi:tRNA threonylcarbamoyladenosine biosynthesis protein TsaE
MQRLEFEARSESDTRKLGRALAIGLPDRATIALAGTLGSGKTRLVQTVAEHCGIDAARVTSPTFVLCQIYHGLRSLYHLDAYRVRDVDEFVELGVEEHFDRPGLTFIEWADRVTDCLPEDRVDIEIEITGSDSRLFQLTAHGPESDQALDRIAEEL